MILSSTTLQSFPTTQLHKMSHELILILFSIALTCCIFNRVHEKKVEIDFDAASRAWRANKVYVGMGEFKYKTPSRIPRRSLRLKKMI